MDRATALTLLKAHEAELRAMGVVGLSLFGSVARDEAGPDSDVDLAAALDRSRPIGLLEFAAIRQRVEDMLGVPVDMISEPIEKERLRRRFDLDRVVVF